MMMVERLNVWFTLTMSIFSDCLAARTGSETDTDDELTTKLALATNALEEREDIVFNGLIQKNRCLLANTIWCKESKFNTI